MGNALGAKYGIDAPDAVRNMIVLGLSSMVLSLILNSILATSQPILGGVLATICLWGGACLLLSGIFIAATSLFTKRIVYRQMIDSLHLRGDEQLLDIGCGRGMLLIEAAKHLTSGKATGIDLWISGDQSGNSMVATMRNAQAEGVQDRVQLETGDMRNMPFPDANFDMVIASLAIHNVHSQQGCIETMHEIDRVTKPGGRTALLDVQNTALYARTLRELGWDTHRSSMNLLMYPPSRVVYGHKL